MPKGGSHPKYSESARQSVVSLQGLYYLSQDLHLALWQSVSEPGEAQAASLHILEQKEDDSIHNWLRYSKYSGLYQGRNFGSNFGVGATSGPLLVGWAGVHLGGIYVRGVYLGHGRASHIWACTL